MKLNSRTVVIGACLAGIRTTQELRVRGYSGEIILVDHDPDAPYDRPPLSKQVLCGTWERSEASMPDPLAAWEAPLIRATAIGADLSARMVHLDSGRSLPYDHLVIATGASPRQFPGAVMPGVHVLRSLADCMALRADLADGGRLVVMGGGFLGAEVAACAAAAGVAATLVTNGQLPMLGSLGPAAASHATELHLAHGVRILSGVRVANIFGGRRVKGVVLSDGTELEADLVVAAIGVTPNTSWLKETDLRLADGVECDWSGRAKGASNVYALGDVAAWARPDGAVERIEHWTSAVEQASVVAMSITGVAHTFVASRVPYFWSDQYDTKIQMIGRHEPGVTAVTVQSKSRPGRLAVVYHNGSAVRACVTFNWPRALAAARIALQRGSSSTWLTDELCKIEALSATGKIDPLGRGWPWGEEHLYGQMDRVHGIIARRRP